MSVLPTRSVSLHEERTLREMTTDREYAEAHGLTLREFQKILLTAQRKRGREPLTEQEQEVWDLAMGNPKEQTEFS